MYVYIYTTLTCDYKCFAHMFGEDGCEGVITQGFLAWMRNSRPDKTLVITQKTVLNVWSDAGGVRPPDPPTILIVFQANMLTR